MEAGMFQGHAMECNRSSRKLPMKDSEGSPTETLGYVKTEEWGSNPRPFGPRPERGALDHSAILPTPPPLITTSTTEGTTIYHA
ncbi:hypothetical protein BMR1_03g01285 [Babesia microti strain RI]|uniref:Uncharacterized protein n=1 Tax=Babesia microti (strain RI) TaxID=1133968 RepID=A0A0K3ATG8_BABMR|nr:hypothetical protein BMR1_03g01285 [Babesia microti strain RI]CTQ40856.1 hypothetical protein BMR1_03g01285 [Babesia microti strain RI]|eukprot:XP_012648867.1 hypothetical protein BMR1_03g01285 [Babesia microti strain RI]